MPRRETSLRLRHMLEHAIEAVSMLRGKTSDDLVTDRQLNLATMRLLEIVGEAAARVPADERERYAGVPWYEIIGLRNRLIHGYDSVDLAIVWEIVQDDLPKLIAALEDAVRKEEQQ